MMSQQQGEEEESKTLQMFHFVNITKFKNLVKLFSTGENIELTFRNGVEIRGHAFLISKVAKISFVLRAGTLILQKHTADPTTTTTTTTTRLLFPVRTLVSMLDKLITPDSTDYLVEIYEDKMRFIGLNQEKQPVSESQITAVTNDDEGGEEDEEEEGAVDDEGEEEEGDEEEEEEEEDDDGMYFIDMSEHIHLRLPFKKLREKMEVCIDNSGSEKKKATGGGDDVDILAIELVRQNQALRFSLTKIGSQNSQFMHLPAEITTYLAGKSFRCCLMKKVVKVLHSMLAFLEKSIPSQGVKRARDNNNNADTSNDDEKRKQQTVVFKIKTNLPIGLDFKSKDLSLRIFAAPQHLN
jgi:hypothetical protein